MDLVNTPRSGHGGNQQKRSGEDTPIRLVERHFVRRIPSSAPRPRDRKEKGIRKRTSYHCRECSIALCVDDCFEEVECSMTGGSTKLPTLPALARSASVHLCSHRSPQHLVQQTTGLALTSVSHWLITCVRFATQQCFLLLDYLHSFDPPPMFLIVLTFLSPNP
ncbi:hypothetical protein PR048_000211 [Dryococelus australis]|uniref:PiggyBac transposable element-derived protein 4 C-terminal zinc-ribbon domain-containing protein n=1 Tax=Dryococelus australis TaxID=614101 RepID=A0ABQ9IDZ9_9NEOP|nr:hypothetical protein PR048_000211 [Dryococelus australis]